MHRTDHYESLDAARGLAAVCVVCLHTSGNLAGLPSLPYASFAVDLFFILSGFVLEHAYGKRLADGWTVGEFLLVRMIRLYPLYLLAMAIGALLLVASFLFARHPPDAATAISDLISGFLMLPSPAHIHGMGQDVLYGIVPPAWSLFFEIFINALFVLMYRRLSWPWLIAVVATSATVLLGCNLWIGSLELGNLWSNVWGGFPRVSFGFFAGVAIYRALHVWSLPKLPQWMVVPLAVAFVGLCTWRPDAALWDSFVVLVALPALVAVASCIEVSGAMARASAVLGAVSYAVYVLHMPMLGFAQQAFRRWSSPDAGNWTGPAFLLLAISFALAADRCYDRPIRRWLTQRSFVRTTHRAAKYPRFQANS